MRTRASLPGVAAANGLFAAASVATAQQGTAEIRGRVMDQSSGALPGATVVVRNQASGVYRQGVSTEDGSYFLTGVTPGVYELTAEMSGFKKYARKDIRLEVGKTASVDVQLEVGGLTERGCGTPEPSPWTIRTGWSRTPISSRWAPSAP